MNEKLEKFNPAVLPPEAMKSFSADETLTGPKRFLYPGQMMVSREPIVITTILGSCAAICLWDSVKRMGGMNHYLLPEGSEDGPNRLRYGNVANAALLKEMLALGCDIRNLRAKLFGGSSAFSANPSQSVGTRNVELAEEFVRKANIPLVSKDVSGKHGRRLVFHTEDGVTLIRDFENP
ncbi:MAG TPA: chemotaxis protein CheD [Candidatus Binatia bacterium]|nr:chemotaxis protein CheD [Candidatus Binatia bacterium]